jgi:hypothetical protein
VARLAFRPDRRSVCSDSRWSCVASRSNARPLSFKSAAWRANRVLLLRSSPVVFFLIAFFPVFFFFAVIVFSLGLLA